MSLNCTLTLACQKLCSWGPEVVVKCSQWTVGPRLQLICRQGIRTVYIRRTMRRCGGSWTVSSPCVPFNISGRVMTSSVPCIQSGNQHTVAFGHKLLRKGINGLFRFWLFDTFSIFITQDSKVIGLRTMNSFLYSACCKFGYKSLRLRQVNCLFEGFCRSWPYETDRDCCIVVLSFLIHIRLGQHHVACDVTLLYWMLQFVRCN